MTLKQRIRFKKSLFYLLGILVIVIILIIAYFFEKLFEISLTVMFFYLFRVVYKKQFHSWSPITCSIISIIVFFIVSYVTVPKNISILMIVITTFAINTISYYTRDYLDIRELIKKLDVNIINATNVKSKFPSLTDLESRIYIAYVHKGRKPISQLAEEFNYSERQMYRIIRQIKEKVIASK